MDTTDRAKRLQELDQPTKLMPLPEGGPTYEYRAPGLRIELSRFDDGGVNVTFELGNPSAAFDVEGLERLMPHLSTVAQQLAQPERVEVRPAQAADLEARDPGK